VICGLLVIAVSVLNLIIPTGLSFSKPILSVNLIVLGAISVIIMIHFPASWNRFAKQWFPFLRTWRGRGIYLILIGGICCSLSWIGILVGIICAFIGIIHFVLLLCYKDDMDDIAIEKELDGGPEVPEVSVLDDFEGFKEEVESVRRKTVGIIAKEPEPPNQNNETPITPTLPVDIEESEDSESK